MDPRPFTFWELMTMVEGYDRNEWDRAAAIAFHFVNTQVKKQIAYHKFHKYDLGTKNSDRLTAKNMHKLKHLFPKPKKD